MNKVKIYSLPTYDVSTDTFKDGPLPKDVDGYFGNKSAQKYYSWYTLFKANIIAIAAYYSFNHHYLKGDLGGSNQTWSSL